MGDKHYRSGSTKYDTRIHLTNNLAGTLKQIMERPDLLVAVNLTYYIAASINHSRYTHSYPVYYVK